MLHRDLIQFHNSPVRSFALVRCNSLWESIEHYFILGVKLNLAQIGLIGDTK